MSKSEQLGLGLDADKYPGYRWFVRDPMEGHVCVEGCGKEPPPAWHEVTLEQYQEEALHGEGPGVVRKDGSVPLADLIWP